MQYKKKYVLHVFSKIYICSGLRGAIAFALSLHLDLEEEKRYVIVTTTLIIVLFTILFLGGSAMPLMKVIYLKHL